jgi:hypothetical protein
MAEPGLGIKASSLIVSKVVRFLAEFVSGAKQFVF